MKKIFLYLIGFISIISCERELDISSIVQKRRLVVNAVINDLDKALIWVSNTTSLSDSIKPKALSNAIVTIEDELGTKTNCLFNAGTEYYEAGFSLVAGKSYLITVKATGFPDATARLLIPEKAALQKATWKDSTGLDSFGFPLGTIRVSIVDNGSSRNYYRITNYYYDDVLAEWFPLVPNTTDAEIDNSAIRTEDGGLIFSDRSFNGTTKNIGFITPFGFSNISPKFLVITENLGEDYYKYFRSLENYRQGGGFFSEPTAIYTNITNGLGIAAGSSIRRDTIQ